MNTMGEVATLTDKLALMPDQMLPRLAQQYKNDAITLSLILGEKNRRDRVRNAPKMQAAAAQPKVNDAVVAGMQPQLPEQVGIGALPAPNMQQMADGGIAGMPEDDGASLLYHNEPVMRMAGGGVARYNGETTSLVADIQRILQKSPYERTQAENEALAQAGYSMERRTIPADSGVASINTYLQSLGPRIRNYLTGGASQLTDEQLAKKPAVGGALTERILRGVGSTPSEAPIYPQASYSNEGRRTAAPVAAAPVSDAAAKPGAGQGGLGDLVPPAAAPRAAAPAAPVATGPDAGKLKEQYLADVGKMAPEKETAESFMARRKAMLGDEGQALSKYEAKLLAQEAALPREKDESFWMAVTQAGLAAAAGKSSNALQNIAEGFGTGLAGYKDALKEFKKAEQERDKAMADIERARRAEKRGDVDAALAFENKSQERLDRHNDRVAAGLASLTGAQIGGEYSLAGHRVSAAATTAAANRTPAEIQLIERYQTDPKFAAAYDRFAQAKRDPMTTEKLRADWLDPMKRMQIAQDYPNVKTFDDYLAVMGAGGAGGSGGFRVVGVR